MPRERDPRRDEAFEIFKHNRNIDLVEIASQLNVPAGTIRGWKNKDNWNDRMNGTFQTEKPKKAERSKKTKGPPELNATEKEIKQLDKSELTDKQKLFCIYQTKYFNAAKAYQKAYGCSYESALSNGYRLMDNDRIRVEIQQLKQAKLGRAMLTEDDIFQKYIDIAFADISDFLSFGQEEVPVMTMYGPLEMVDEDGKKVKITKIVNTVKFKESSEVDGTLISEVKQGKDGASIKLQDKMKAIQWLSDRMDLLPTDTRSRLEKEQQLLRMAQEKHDKEMGSDIKEPIEIKFTKASKNRG